MYSRIQAIFARLELPYLCLKSWNALAKYLSRQNRCLWYSEILMPYSEMSIKSQASSVAASGSILLPALQNTIRICQIFKFEKLVVKFILHHWNPSANSIVWDLFTPGICEYWTHGLRLAFNYFIAWKFHGMKILRFCGRHRKTAKLKCREKWFWAQPRN